MIKDLEERNLVHVQLLISGFTGHGNEAWKNVGTMKRKEFLKMIKPHKPIKSKSRQTELSDSFWNGYQQV